MGITVREMLDSDFFKDFKVMAGHRGLDNQIQGLTIIDAPDGYKWTKGREFVVSSGYVFNSNPDYFEHYLNSEEIKKHSAFGIKIDRYFKEIPEKMINIFEKNNVPLINIPTKYAWMEIYNAVDVLVMNKNIRKFNIGKIEPMSYSDLSYQVRKINTILNALEYEMKFPAMLYDLINEKCYYSSNKFKELSQDLKIEDFWNPSFNYSKEILCDNLKMARYRFFDDRYDKPYSWITVPINVSGRVRAYFVVMEATELLDYYDQFAIRIGFVQLQSMYEQILVAQSIGDKGFSSLINKIVMGGLKDKESIMNKASELNIDINNKYYMFIIEQKNKEITLSAHNEILASILRRSFSANECRISLIDDNRCVFMYKSDENLEHKKETDILMKKISNYYKRLELDLENAKLKFGLSDVQGYIYETERNYERCLRALRIGPHLYPDKDIWSYTMLGAFAWMDIKYDEFDIMMKEIKMLYKIDEHKELIETLRVYIENNMNYSLTAEKMYIHINTVRKRIEKILDFIDIDLNDSVNRLKVELMLKLI